MLTCGDNTSAARTPSGSRRTFQASRQQGRCRLLTGGASTLPSGALAAPTGGFTPRGLQGEAKAPPARGTYRCQSCRKRPAGGWAHKCKPPPPSHAGSSCRGAQRGSSATPSCCPPRCLLTSAEQEGSRCFVRLTLLSLVKSPRSKTCLPPHSALLMLSLASAAQPSLGETERA